jgi:hypothetical protein
MHSAQPTPAAEMPRMFLPEVQDNPQPSPYFELIRSEQNSGREYWQIWHLFAFRAEITAHLARFTPRHHARTIAVVSGLSGIDRRLHFVPQRV